MFTPTKQTCHAFRFAINDEIPTAVPNPRTMAARAGVSENTRRLGEYVLIMTCDTAIANTAVLGPQWLARLEGPVKITSRHDSGTDIPCTGCRRSDRSSGLAKLTPQ